MIRLDNARIKQNIDVQLELITPNHQNLGEKNTTHITITVLKIHSKIPRQQIFIITTEKC